MTIAGFNGEYRFLSNFYPSPINFEGVDYPTVEHAYQAAKTENLPNRLAIPGLTAGEAKTYGRNLVLRSDWDSVKESIMLTLLRKKFRIPELAMKLVGTHAQHLIETNYWHDNYWGACTCHNCQVRLEQPGKNMLGHLLMQVRYEITHGREFDAVIQNHDSAPVGSRMEEGGQ